MFGQPRSHWIIPLFSGGLALGGLVLLLAYWGIEAWQLSQPEAVARTVAERDARAAQQAADYEATVARQAGEFAVTLARLDADRDAAAQQAADDRAAADAVAREAATARNAAALQRQLERTDEERAADVRAAERAAERAAQEAAITAVQSYRAPGQTASLLVTVKLTEGRSARPLALHGWSARGPLSDNTFGVYLTATLGNEPQLYIWVYDPKTGAVRTSDAATKRLSGW